MVKTNLYPFCNYTGLVNNGTPIAQDPSVRS